MKLLILTVCIFCLIASIVRGQTHPQAQIRSATDHKAITAGEKQQALGLANRFIRRLQETRDLQPLLKEFFVNDLQKSGLKDDLWSRSVNLNVPEGAELSEDELWKYYALKFGVEYLSALYVASKVPLESLDIEKPDRLEDVLPKNITEYSKTIKLPDEKIKPTDLAHWVLTVREHTLKLWQQEFAERPPEKSETFKRNLIAFAAHLEDKRNIWGQPSVIITEQESKPQRFIRMEIPFHIGLILVKENGQLKIWFAATFIPPD